MVRKISNSYELGRRKRSWGRAWRFFAVLFLACLIAVILVIRTVYNRNLQPISASQRSIVITVQPGSGVKAIATELEKQGVIRAAWAFEWYVRNSQARGLLQAGTYNLRPNQSVAEIVTVLTQGDIAKGLITFLPGQRLDQIRSALIHNGGFSEAEVDAALNPDLYTNEPALVDKPPGANLEGFLYPDSYEKTDTTKPEDLVRTSLAEMHSYLTPDIRDAYTNHGLTTYEAIILASIVNQEVSNPDDMPKVAQVFLSRLKQSMPLQSDVTAIYGALKAGQEPSVTYKSTYNTYENKGLPPGPISNVTKEALQAVANPASTDYLYFVAGDDGKTYFSRTIEEHERLTEQHCTDACGN